MEGDIIGGNLISLDRKKGLGSVFFSGTRVPEKRLSRPYGGGPTTKS